MARIYRLRQGDTLEGIASRLLGTPARWPELVALNNLRWPFISERPQDQLGPPRAIGQLGAPLVAGSGTVALTLLDPHLAMPQGRLYLAAHDASGTLAQETLVVASSGPLQPDGTVLVALSTPPQRTWPTGTPWTLTDDPATLTTRVLRPGDALVVPDDAQLEAPLAADADALESRLGTDIALDPATGQLRWDPDRRDLALVAGVANLVQAVAWRLATPPGALPLQPTYGNPLLTFVGQRHTVTFRALAEGYLRRALAQEPRIGSVVAVGVEVARDAVDVRLVLALQGGAGVLEVPGLRLALSP